MFLMCASEAKVWIHVGSCLSSPTNAVLHHVLAPDPTSPRASSTWASTPCSKPMYGNTSISFLVAHVNICCELLRHLTLDRDCRAT